MASAVDGSGGGSVAVPAASSGDLDREILARVWQRVRPGGRVVIMDAKAPSGAIGRLVSAGLRRFGLSTGAPEPSVTAPWSDLASLGATVEVQEWAFGSYFVAVGEKNRT